MSTLHLPPLPHWDMTVVYPGLASTEFTRDFARIVQSIKDLEALFDLHHIQEQPPQEVNSRLVQTFETVLTDYNTVIDDSSTLSTYLICFTRTNSQDDLAQARLSELRSPLARLTFLGTRLTAWIGSLDIETLIERSAVAHEHAYSLRRAKVQSTHLMTPAEEALTAELNMSGGSAWSRLHGNITSQMTMPLELDGQMQEVSLSIVRNLAYESRAEVRRKAYESELAAWKRAALPLAAALNSIKGEVNVLTRKRHWESPLEESLFDNSIDQQTLDALLAAARESFPDFRRYLRSKARALGLSQLAWYDICAPLGADGKVWEFDEATTFIIEQFGTYSARLADFAARAFRERWVDAEPRPGKRDGASCIRLRADESRILTNYKPSFVGVGILAHELGHGYHNLNQAGRTPLQRTHPMTLAETASIFCETIIRQAALRNADASEQIAILDASLQNSCLVVVDIISRFLFEQRIFEQRKQRELSIDEFNALMLEAQRETYGDGLDESTLHPYMWAVKQHYYSTTRWFYNYPYMFGLLFGLGLYARYQQAPEAFREEYDELLSSTGLADAATLAARFGIDLHSQAFWRASLDVIRADINRFEELVETSQKPLQKDGGI